MTASARSLFVPVFRGVCASFILSFICTPEFLRKAGFDEIFHKFMDCGKK